MTELIARGRTAATLFGTATSCGSHRGVNEDSLLAVPPVFAVADGMGGHEAGEIASRVAVEALAELAGRASVTGEELHAQLQYAESQVRAIHTDRGRAAGTTVSGVALSAQNGLAYWLVFNLGDSRTYRLADRSLEQISVDHSEVQELIEAGRLRPEDAAGYPRRHVVTKALGAGAEHTPDYWLIPMDPTDRILICSDGLTAELSDGQIEGILTGQDDPQAAADCLVEAALTAGGHDNVTVVVVDAGRGDRSETGAEPNARATQTEGHDLGYEGDTLPRRRQLNAGGR